MRTDERVPCLFEIEVSNPTKYDVVSLKSDEKGVQSPNSEATRNEGKDRYQGEGDSDQPVTSLVIAAEKVHVAARCESVQVRSQIKFANLESSISG